MPYYIKKDITNNSNALNSLNTILFVHIPKTGGTSVESFLRNTNLYKEILFSSKQNDNRKILPDDTLNFIHLQHHSLRTITEYQSLFEIDLSTTSLFLTIVRNPYDRAISELFWRKLVKPNDTKLHVFKKLYTLFHNKSIWGKEHFYPQHTFLRTHQNELEEKFIICKTENLTSELRQLKGIFSKFNTQKNVSFKPVNPINKLKYVDYLNKDSILLINELYFTDFELFNYEMF